MCKANALQLINAAEPLIKTKLIGLQLKATTKLLDHESKEVIVNLSLI